jgi:hypothetical protein
MMYRPLKAGRCAWLFDIRDVCSAGRMGGLGTGLILKIDWLCYSNSVRSLLPDVACVD